MSWTDKNEQGSGWTDKPPPGTTVNQTLWAYNDSGDTWAYGENDSWAADSPSVGTGTLWTDQAEKDTPWSP
jgi:hypothetical protein